MIVVVAIDTKSIYRLLGTLRDAETAEYVLGTGVTSKFQMRQLGHAGVKWVVAEWWVYLLKSHTHDSRRHHRYRGLKPLVGDLYER